MAKPTIARDERNALLTVKRIADAVIATINETPEGAPAGPMYAALMTYMNLEQFEALMRLLVEAGRIAQRGDLYFPKGRP